MKPTLTEVLRVVREHTCYELAEHYILKVEGFYRLLLQALECGVPAAKVFLTMWMNRREWTCSELAAATSSHRQKVNEALKKLMRKGLVERVNRKWVLNHAVFDVLRSS
ncbi:hypothetical protein KEJ25_01920 [Candidatus Bathyarchaeota archaeon]|nr:hypothetical protein [Candidatus Bathyarchaeota archaeon]